MIVNARSDYLMFYRDFTYTNLSAASPSNSIVLFRCPPRTVIRTVKLIHDASFTGGAISAYTVSVGTLASPEKFASRYDVFQAPGSTTFQLSASVGADDNAAFWNLYLSAYSVGANLNAATAGSLDVTIEMIIM